MGDYGKLVQHVSMVPKVAKDYKHGHTEVCRKGRS